MSEEIWKSLKGVVENGDNYEVSSLGKVRNVIKGNLLKLRIGTTGYPIVTLALEGSKKIYKVHRLVALAFIPNPENKHDVNHISGDKTDNRVTNLEWSTRSENILHAYRTGLRNREDNVRSGKMAGKASGALRAKRVSMFSLTGEFIKEYESTHEASRQTGVLQPTIHFHCKKKCTPTKFEFYFRYSEDISPPSQTHNFLRGTPHTLYQHNCTESEVQTD